MGSLWLRVRWCEHWQKTFAADSGVYMQASPGAKTRHGCCISLVAVTDVTEVLAAVASFSDWFCFAVLLHVFRLLLLARLLALGVTFCAGAVLYVM